MAEKSKPNNIQFLICPACKNSLKIKGLKCQNCSGHEIIAYYKGRFFYWRYGLTRPIIKLRHLKSSFRLAVNLSSFIIGLIGLASLGYWIHQTSLYTEELSVFAFWRAQNDLIMIFWFSLFADMFVIYRLSEEEALKKKINKIKYGEKISDFPASSWVEFNQTKEKYKIEISSGFSLPAINIVEQAFILANI